MVITKNIQLKNRELLVLQGILNAMNITDDALGNKEGLGNIFNPRFLTKYNYRCVSELTKLQSFRLTTRQEIVF